MCGIIAYLGNKDCIEYLLNGLYKLQNRGYDSVGISRIINNQIISTLEKKLNIKLRNKK